MSLHHLQTPTVPPAFAVGDAVEIPVRYFDHGHGWGSARIEDSWSRIDVDCADGEGAQGFLRGTILRPAYVGGKWEVSIVNGLAGASIDLKAESIRPAAAQDLRVAA
ncbi:hypothetical protein [Brevundimonas sp. NIBR11]|uniref:hypothetical protein n=1 Tax=Brevundimonas sp. NIBR11 TaxID=3015999 RepID=UPI0022F037E8|nr:hypothetical protein [Brevundimonas sp. NIBR11]WGM31468.1 hypothetical protein KKHFBJBL_01715 [Brevundimonas sp. NIBR11]